MRVDATAALTASLIQRLEARDSVSAEEAAVLEVSVQDARIVQAGDDLVSDGDRPSNSSLIVSGVAARYSLLPGGSRQITALHLPGDFVDLHSFLLKTMDHGVLAISRCRVATMPHERLTEISRTHPHLMRLLWLMTLIDGSLHREWLVGLGRRSAISRLAHLLCETRVRLDCVGGVDADGFDLPVTQADLSDILGLSSVHVNRVLQELRGAGLVTWRGARVTLPDWPRLVALAEFDDRYLHLAREPR